MMNRNRIDRCFAELKAENKKAVITFLTAGAPDMSTTERAVQALFDNGADIVELGVPFSDPVAESVPIQRASLRSLKNGTTLDLIFEAVKNIRKSCDKPLLLVMYLNTIFAYGKERFFDCCKENGIDGVIVPDMPYEEREEILDMAKQYGVHGISMVSPVSRARVGMIAAQAEGFLYCVAADAAATPVFMDMCRHIRENTETPYCVECNTTEEAAVKCLADAGDGIIVSSAIVECMEENGEPVDGDRVIARITTLVRKIAGAMGRL